MEVSTSAIGTGAPFSVNPCPEGAGTEPPELLGSRSSTGALLFTTSTWMKAFAVLLLLAPSLTHVDDAGGGRRRGAGVVNVICCNAV